MQDMKLGLQLGYWGSAAAQCSADWSPRPSAWVRLGVDGRGLRLRCPHPLSWWGSQTTKVRLGTALCQLSARTPTAMAMAAITLDHLSGGRFVLGPRACPGPRSSRAGTASRSRSRWPGPASTWTSCARSSPAKAPVTNDGPHYPLPYPGRHRAGQAAQAHRASRCARRSRSSWGPRGRRTWPWPPRSPTAGSPSSSPPTRSRPSSRPWPKDSPAGGPAPGRRLRGHRLRSHHHRRRHRAGRRPDATLHRPLHRRAWGPSR